MRNLLIILLSTLPVFCAAQGNPIFEPNPIVSQNGLSLTSIEPYEKPQNPNLISAYQSNSWQIGNVHLFSKEVVKSYPIKYDFGLNHIEIKDSSNDTIVYVQGHQIRQFVLMSEDKKIHKFINELKYTGKAYPPVFYEQLTEGKTELLKKVKVVLIKSNYNATLDVGSKTDKKMLKYELCFFNGKELIKLKKSKGSVLEVLIGKKTEIKEFIKSNKLSIKKEADLVQIFNYYNSII
jgi:hypothetical protein